MTRRTNHVSMLGAALVAACGLIGIAALVLLAAAPATGAPREAASQRPNIVLVMTDDQDVATLRSLPGLPAFESDCGPRPGTVMPCLEELVASRGVTFERHTAAFPLCCPSRATFLSGQYGHNNGVRGNFQYDNLDKDRVLPLWLQEAGYTTAYAGKYQGPIFLGWGHPDHPGGVPRGWDRFWGVSDVVPTYTQYNYVIDDNGVPVFYGSRETDYQADVLTGIATDFIEDHAAEDDAPFFLGIGYAAPHWALGSEVEPPGVLNNPRRFVAGDIGFKVEQSAGPPVPAPRHMDELERFLGAGMEVLRSASFNEPDVSDKPAFVRSQPPLNEQEIARLDQHYAFRLASLLSVDEGIEEIVDALKRTGEYENTYFIFTSDNGWLQGEHRLLTTKVHAYEESTRIPLIISGPGVSEGSHAGEANSNVDWAATILDLAGARPDPGFELDGMSLLPYLSNPERRLGRVVFHETTDDENGYVAARAGRWKYIEYNTGERELYDLRSDPNELASRHDDPRVRPVIDRLSALLARFRTCHGQSGENPCLVTGVRDPAVDP